jgi:hypothetical protein
MRKGQINSVKVIKLKVTYDSALIKLEAYMKDKGWVKIDGQEKFRPS